MGLLDRVPCRSPGLPCADVPAHGFRPASYESHANTLAYLRCAVGDEKQSLVAFFDRMRVKRHQAVYESADSITRTEAEALIVQAQEFIAWVAEAVTE